jgi:hypothetical protein
MAMKYAVADGNWSSTSTWNSGTIPATGDDVYANNHTVTVDQDITPNSLRNVASSPAVAGGKFLVAAAPVSITIATGIVASYINAAASPLIDITAASGTVTISAGAGLDVYGGSVAGAHGIQVSSTATGVTVNLTADLNGGSGAAAMRVAVAGATTAVINITEPSSGSGTAYGGTLPGLWLDNTSVAVNLNGAVYSGGTAGATAAGIQSTGTGSPTITATDVLAESAGYAVAFSNTGGTPIITVSGDLKSQPNGGIPIYLERGRVVANGTVTFGGAHPPVYSTINGEFVLGSAATISINDSTTFSPVTYSRGGSGGPVRPATGIQWPLPR